MLLAQLCDVFDVHTPEPSRTPGCSFPGIELRPAGKGLALTKSGKEQHRTLRGVVLSRRPAHQGAQRSFHRVVDAEDREGRRPEDPLIEQRVLVESDAAVAGLEFRFRLEERSEERRVGKGGGSRGWAE